MLQSLRLHQWVYLGADASWRIRAEQAAGPRPSRLSVADSMDEISWRLRQPYIDWVGDLSNVNDSLEWWASGLAEKNPFARLYVDICLLAVARRLISQDLGDPVLMICSSPALLQEVARFADEADVPVQRVAGRHQTISLQAMSEQGRRLLRRPYRLARRTAGRLTGKAPEPPDADPIYRRKVLDSHGEGTVGAFSGDDTVLAFTWVDQRNFTSTGSYSDPHLGCLPAMLREQGYRIGYVARVLPTIPFEEAVTRLLATNETLFFPEHLVTLADLEWCRQQADSHQPEVHANSKVAEIPVYSLAREQIERDQRGLAETLSYERLVANLATAGVQPKQMVHTCEGHSWERVLAWSVRKYMPGTKVVGYDTGTYSRLHLSMYPAASECNTRPLPDRIVTNGPLPRDTLVAGGLPPEVVTSGCAVRYAEASRPRGCVDNADGAAPGDAVRILVATSINLGDSVELVAKSAQAFGGNPDTEVVVKCHPMVGTEQVIRHLGKSWIHSNLSFTDSPVDELLPSVRVLLYTHTNVCYEALSHGVIPVFVRAENTLNLDKLEATPDVRWVATTPGDLVRAVSEIVKMSAREMQAWRDRAAEVLRAAMAPVTSRCVDAFLI